LEGFDLIRYNYFNQVDPPAPFVTLILRNAATGAEMRKVPAQLDSGAYRTVLPVWVAEALGLVPLGPLFVQGLGGAAMSVPVYAVLLGVHDLPTQLIEVLAHVDEPYVLLVRDVLNGLRLLLDGPNLKLEIG
jgi:hypothetical protein